MNIPLIRELSRQLDINYGVMLADIRALAWLWEMIVGRSPNPSGEFVILACLDIVSAYMRGRNIKTGNYAGWKRHGLKTSVLATLITEEVIEGSQCRYDALHRAGVSSVEGYFEMMKNIPGQYSVLDEVKHILDGGVYRE